MFVPSNKDFEYNSNLKEELKNSWQSVYKPAIEQYDCLAFNQPFNLIRNLEEKYLVADKDAYKFSPWIEEIADLVRKDFADVGILPNVGIHWRFNKDDWAERCTLYLNENGQAPEECSLINNLDYEKFLVNLKSASESSDISSKSFYIAAPENEKDTMNLLKQTAEKLNLKIYTLTDIETILNKRFHTCSWLLRENYKIEVISLVEQEILTKMDVFYDWKGSSWSDRIRDYRWEILEKATRQNLFDIFANSGRS